MNKGVSSKKVSENHISASLSDETMKQIKLRINLLNDFLKDGITDGFDAHKLQSTFLAYSNGKGIISRSRPAIADKNCPVGEIDPQYKIDPTKIVNCLDYIELKRKELISQQRTIKSIEADNNENNVETKIALKTITKGRLKQVINEQADLIRSLARELLLQRSANNNLISLIKEADHRHQMTLRPYYANHQDELLKTRKKNSSQLSDVISTLKDVSEELNALTVSTTDNIVSMWAKK